MGSNSSRSCRHRLVFLQIGLVLAAFATMMALPPARGSMVLVPIHAGARVAAVAVAHGALIEAAGPLPGSLVVRGERAQMVAPLLAIGVLTLAAPAALCGHVTA